MSLVDYASDEEEENGEDGRRMDEDTAPALHHNEGSAPGTTSSTRVSIPPSTNSRGPSSETPFTPSPIRLPDAAELLGASIQAGSSSSSGGEPASMNMSRKRPQLNGGGHHTKIPRGNSAPSRTRLETTGGTLVPPQLRGRSNVATEDLDKLFVHRQQRRSE